MLIETWDVETQQKLQVDAFNELKRKWWAQLPLQGNTGVDAFFVLSGLLMTRSYQKLCQDSFLKRYGVFLLGRFFRLWPMVLTASCASLLMGLLVPSCSLSVRWPTIWAHLLLVQNWYIESLKNPDLAVLWSLGTEMQMYLATCFSTTPCLNPV